MEFLMQLYTTAQQFLDPLNNPCQINNVDTLFRDTCSVERTCKKKKKKIQRKLLKDDMTRIS